MHAPEASFERCKRSGCIKVISDRSKIQCKFLLSLGGSCYCHKLLKQRFEIPDTSIAITTVNWELYLTVKKVACAMRTVNKDLTKKAELANSTHICTVT